MRIYFALVPRSRNVNNVSLLLGFKIDCFHVQKVRVCLWILLTYCKTNILLVPFISQIFWHRRSREIKDTENFTLFLCTTESCKQKHENSGHKNNLIYQIVNISGFTVIGCLFDANVLKIQSGIYSCFFNFHFTILVLCCTPVVVVTTLSGQWTVIWVTLVSCILFPCNSICVSSRPLSVHLRMSCIFVLHTFCCKQNRLHKKNRCLRLI